MPVTFNNYCYKTDTHIFNRLLQWWWCYVWSTKKLCSNASAAVILVEGLKSNSLYSRSYADSGSLLQELVLSKMESEQLSLFPLSLLLLFVDFLGLFLGNCFCESPFPEGVVFLLQSLLFLVGGVNSSSRWQGVEVEVWDGGWGFSKEFLKAVQSIFKSVGFTSGTQTRSLPKWNGDFKLTKT